MKFDKHHNNGNFIEKCHLKCNENDQKLIEWNILMKLDENCKNLNSISIYILKFDKNLLWPISLQYKIKHN